MENKNIIKKGKEALEKIANNPLAPLIGTGIKIGGLVLLNNITSSGEYEFPKIYLACSGASDACLAMFQGNYSAQLEGEGKSENKDFHVKRFYHPSTEQYIMNGLFNLLNKAVKYIKK